MVKVYLDLEATQFTEDIISLGAVTEFGDEFYTLVRPKKVSKITQRITNLTGLTQDMFDESVPELPEVSKSFIEWCSNFDLRNIKFFCYGGFDRVLFKRGYERTNSEELKFILDNLCDICKGANILLGMQEQGYSLGQLYERLYGEPCVHDHNALHDAILLKDVHKKVVELPFDALKDFYEQKMCKKYIHKYKRGKMRANKIRAFLNTVPYEDLDSLTIHDLAHLGDRVYERIEASIKKEYYNLTGTKLKGLIYERS